MRAEAQSPCQPRLLLSVFSTDTRHYHTQFSHTTSSKGQRLPCWTWESAVNNCGEWELCDVSGLKRARGSNTWLAVREVVKNTWEPNTTTSSLKKCCPVTSKSWQLPPSQSLLFKACFLTYTGTAGWSWDTALPMWAFGDWLILSHLSFTLP